MPQAPVTGAPVTAEQRPLYFKHAVRLAKGGLTAEQYERLVNYEQTRSTRQQEER